MRLSVKRSVSVAVCVLSVLTVCLSGCRPKGILHSWEMRHILVDLHKTDALLQTYNLSQASPEDKALYYAQVLQKHGVTQAEFDSSLVWYTAHPQLFDKIYPKVLADLKAEEDAFVAAHEQALHLAPQAPEEMPQVHPFTQAEMDSTLWVTLHGWPTMWEPLPFAVHPADTLPLPLVHYSED